MNKYNHHFVIDIAFRVEIVMKWHSEDELSEIR